MLGYSTHAEYVLEEHMAKTPKEVLDFEHDLRERLTVLGLKEVEEIEELKRADKRAVGEEYTGLFSWDFRYYTNLVKERKHNISDEEVKQYFPMKEVTRGILDIYQRMLSLRFVKVENPPCGTRTSTCTRCGKPPRTSSSATSTWTCTRARASTTTRCVADPRRLHQARRLARVSCCCHGGQLPQAVGTTPALLKHDDATTLLHELGHMLENWCWEPSVLAQFAVHYKTGEPIPDELVKRLVAAKNESAGLFNLRQVFFGLYDMAIHNTEDGKVDVKNLYTSLREEIGLFKNGDIDTWGSATFGHMMGGYDSGYYGYLWSEKEGVANASTGMDYRREILAAWRQPRRSVSLEKFLGRKPNQQGLPQEYRT
ncbi:zincin [Linderina pennispora]|uniref:Zincin n=1 Tax=Linderina pennispora TaxID=61395 RepID=A0A1Y1VS91_9FUNG|nr:zincin [Linderina pennispora]ORX64160.1 zincin [Linderina pennispora]